MLALWHHLPELHTGSAQAEAGRGPREVTLPKGDPGFF